MSTTNDYINKLVNIHQEILTLNEDVKLVLADIKENTELDAALMNKVAKAKAQEKLGDLESKTQELIDLIEEVN